jgi:hypothetical protein
MSSAHVHALDFPIIGTGPLSQAVLSRGHTRFAQVAEAVRALPYGRVRDLESVSAVVDEQKGTCSSKHRYLAALAHENGRHEITLMLGLYEMSRDNTPGVGPTLESEGLAAVPEAHCYLMRGDQRYDFTGLPTGSRSPLEALIDERVVSPTDLPKVKVPYHRAALATWANARGLDPERLWALRERCIELLANSTPHTDARVSAVFDQPLSARAGERER